MEPGAGQRTPETIDPIRSEQKCSHLDWLSAGAAIGTVLQGGAYQVF